MSTTDMHDDNIELKAVILCGTFHVSPWDNTIITCYTWHLSGYLLQRVELNWCLEKCADSDPYIVNTARFLISWFMQICATFNSQKWPHFKVLNSDVRIFWTIWIMNIKSVHDGNLLNKNTNCKKISLESTVAKNTCTLY
jgi:hypothetical protein